MAFMWKEDSSYKYKLDLEDDIEEDKSTNKSSKCMLQLGAATASNWGGNVFPLMLKTKDFSSQHVARSNNELREESDLDPLYSCTPCSCTSNPTKTIGNNKAIKASLDLKDGEYVLKLTAVKRDGTTAAEQAQTAAMLLSQAALLRQLGEKLLKESEFFKSLDI